MTTTKTVEPASQQVEDLLALTPLECNILLPFHQRIQALMAEKEHVEQMIGAMHLGANSALALMIAQRKLEGTYGLNQDLTSLVKQDPEQATPIQPAK